MCFGGEGTFVGVYYTLYSLQVFVPKFKEIIFKNIILPRSPFPRGFSDEFLKKSDSVLFLEFHVLKMQNNLI